MFRKLILLCSLIIIVCGTPFTPPPPARSQSGDALPPPQVIDVWPAPGMELALDEALTMTFDQPMDRASVESALTFTPPVEGHSTWIDTQTLTFKPAAGWMRAQSYTVTIGTRAAASTRQALETPYSVKIRTLGGLEVAEISPKADAKDVTLKPQIVVSFSRPIVPLSPADAPPSEPAILRFDPPVDGEGQWINTSIYAFTPAEPLRMNTRYTVSIQRGLTSVDNVPMDKDYSWSFQTVPPQVTQIRILPDYNEDRYSGRQTYDLKQVPLDRPILVLFAQPMEQRSAEAAFSLSTRGSKVPGKFGWSSDLKEMTFTPDHSLTAQTDDYVAKVAATARSSDGSMLGKDTELRFATVPYPAVESVSPAVGETITERWRRATIVFNVAMIGSMIDVDIQPKPDDISPRLHEDERTYEIAFSMQPNTTYTLTLKAGAQDLYGNVIKNDYTFHLTTGALDPVPQPLNAHLLVNGDLMITNAARQNTSIVIDAPPAEGVKFSLYRLPPTEIGDKPLLNHQVYGWNRYYYDDTRYERCGPPPAVKPTNLMRSGVYTIPENTTTSRFEIPLASDKGGKLPPGLYWITLGDKTACQEAPNGPTMGGYKEQVGLAVVTANMTIKRGTEDVFVWVTDLANTSPLADATVTVYSQGKALSSGKTNGSGIIKLPVRVLEDRFILITAEKPGAFAAWYNNWANGWRNTLPGEGYGYDWDSRYIYDPWNIDGYLYTDRPIYRPGDTVKFRGVMRYKRDMTFPVPQEHSVYVKIGRGYNDYGYASLSTEIPPVFDGQLPLTEYGTFSGEFRIPEDGSDAPEDYGHAYVIQASLTKPAPHGDNDYDYYYQPTNTITVGVTVAAYRPSAFEVVVKPGKDVIVQGDPVETVIQGSYYFGGPVTDAYAEWSAYVCPTAFQYTGPGRYHFGEGGWYDSHGWADYYGYYWSCWYGGDHIDSGTGRTASDGSITVSNKFIFDATERYRDQPLRITIEGTIHGDNDEVSGRSSLLAYPSNLFIGLNAHAGARRVKQPVTLDLIAVKASSQIRPGQALEVNVEHFAWQSSEWNHFQPFTADTLKTGEDGKAVYTLLPTRPGVYHVTVKGADEKGRQSTSSLYFWITDASTIEQSWADPERGINLLTDRRAYQPGEVADILIPVPFPGHTTVLVTAERAGVITYDVFKAAGATVDYHLPITDAYAPTVYIQAVYITDVDAENPYPRYRASVPVSFSIDSAKPRLTVKLTPSTKQARPGQTVKFDVKVTDSEGKPARAEVGLALADKAVLALALPNSGTLLDAFYGTQRRFIYTDLSLDGLLEAVDEVNPAAGPDGRGGGGGGGGEPTPRNNYDTTPLWLPHLLTDDSGRATVEVKLPDNLTTWQLDARALTLDMKVGQTTTEIVSSLPLMVNPVTPRFFVAGDRLQLAATINNNTGADQTVQARLEAKGLRLEGPNPQTLTIGVGRRARVIWPVVVEDAPDADLTFYANGQDGAQDAAKPTLHTGPDGTIPIYQYTVPDIGRATSGVIRVEGARTEVISLPARLNTGQGDLTVRLDSSLASALTASFTYLRQYPYYCIEQTTSTFLPNVTTFRSLRDLGLADPSLEAKLHEGMNAALVKLADAQNADGGWGWWKGTNSHPLITAYAALGLIEARRAGYDIGPKLGPANIERALAYVKTKMSAPLSLENWQLNRQAIFAYVLARAGQGSLADYTSLFDVRQRMSYGARAFLLLAYQEQFPNDPAVKTLVNDLVSAAKLSSIGAYWEEGEIDWWNWGSNIRTTALALTALIRATPDSTLLPNAVRWLMSARQGDHWPTTQETVWSTTALADWMVLTKELQGSYHYAVRFNQQSLTQQDIKPGQPVDTQVLRIGVKDVLANQTNRLVVSRGDGAGALYYTAQLNLRLPAADAKPVNRGIAVTREYFAEDNSKTPVTEVHVGDTVTVRLTMQVSQDVQYLMLEDTFPAGMEPVNADLLTSKHGAEDPYLRRLWYGDSYWYWGWSYFNHTELSDSHANLYADYLPRGTYVYTYQIRAYLPGDYQAIPATASTFYFADLFGRSAGSVFHILP